MSIVPFSPFSSPVRGTTPFVEEVLDEDCMEKCQESDSDDEDQQINKQINYLLIEEYLLEENILCDSTNKKNHIIFQKHQDNYLHKINNFYGDTKHILNILEKSENSLSKINSLNKNLLISNEYNIYIKTVNNIKSIIEISFETFKEKFQINPFMAGFKSIPLLENVALVVDEKTPADFPEKVLNAITRIKSGEVGGRLLRKISEGYNQIHVVYSPVESQFIKVNLPSLQNFYFIEITDRPCMSFGYDLQPIESHLFISLAHEFIHALHISRGKDKSKSFTQDPETWTNDEEFVTIVGQRNNPLKKRPKISENAIRSEHGLPERFSHKGFYVGDINSSVNGGPAKNDSSSNKCDSTMDVD